MLQHARGVGSRTVGCGTRRVTLPAMRAESRCDPRGFSRVVSATPPPALPGARLVAFWVTATVPDSDGLPDSCATSYLAVGGGGRAAGVGPAVFRHLLRCGGAMAAAIVAPTNLGSEVSSLVVRGRCGLCEDRSVVTPPPFSSGLCGNVPIRVSAPLGADGRVRCGAAGCCCKRYKRLASAV